MRWYNGLMKKTALLISTIGAFFIAISSAVAGGDFAFELYRNASIDEDDNFIISPYSAKMAIGSAAAGATGETFRQMVDAIGIAATNGASLVDALAFERDAVLSATNKATTIEITDSLWPITDRGIKLKDDFVTCLAKGLSTTVKPTSIAKGQGEINAFVDKATHGRIPKLLEQPLEPSTELVILNTIYFNGKWDMPFIKEETTKGSFVADGKKMAALFMNKTGRYCLFESSEYSTLSVPYVRGERGDDPYEMMVILPASTNSIKAVEKSISMEGLVKARQSAKACEVALAMPKFAFDATIPLTEPLKALGVKRAFGAAELGGIAEGNLSISDVLQKATIEVDESGTIATAATSMMVRMTALAPPPRPFVLNRPFLFVVWHPTSKQILFVGRVKSPKPSNK